MLKIPTVIPFLQRNGNRLCNISKFKENIAKSKSYRQLSCRVKVKWRRSVVSDSSRPHGLQPTRLLCPWEVVLVLFPSLNKIETLGRGIRQSLEWTVSVQFSRSVVSNSLWPHESQHARPSCPSPTPGFHPDSRPSSQWCHPAISSSAVPFSSCP